MSAVSDDLVWSVVNTHNSFKVTSKTGRRTTFSSEQGNLTNEHSFRASGLMSKSVGLVESAKGATLVKTTKGGASKPAKSVAKIAVIRGPKKSAKTINAALDKSFHRRDLTKAALARVERIRDTKNRARSGKAVQNGRK